jgi:hypothetical protein
MMESWIKEACPECGAFNWYCNGDPGSYGVDIERVICWKCKQGWYVDEYCKVFGPDESINEVTGMEKPDG